MTKLRAAAFLDRDGVINRDHGYVGRWEDFEFLPGAIEGMRLLQQAGYALIVVTNQSGIARGFYTEADFQSLTRRMLEELQSQGVHVTAVYHCPHHPEGKVPELAIECACRKPAPGMLLRAAAEHELSLADSVMIGDKPSDLEAAQHAGLGCIATVGFSMQDLPKVDDLIFSEVDLFRCSQRLSNYKRLAWPN